MLKCKDVAERASALIDQELGLIETFQMRLHLAMCNGCKAFVEQIRMTRDLTQRALDAVDPNEADDRRIAAILSQLPEQKQSGD